MGLTKLRNSAVQRGISEFLVEIVLSGGRLVSDDNAVSLDVVLVLLKNLCKNGRVN